MVQSASSTSVGAGRSGSKSVTPRSSGGTQVKQRYKKDYHEIIRDLLLKERLDRLILSFILLIVFFAGFVFISSREVLFEQDVLKPRKGGSSAPAARTRTAASSSGMWRFYTEDSPGLKVGPVPVLVMSLLFIASVFMLHIWGKYTRG